MEVKGNILLAKRDGVGVIQRCRHGVVHIHVGRASLRFKEKDFIDFALMVNEASSRLMDEAIAELIPDTDGS